MVHQPGRLGHRPDRLQRTAAGSRTKASTDVIFELSTDNGGIMVVDGPGGQASLRMDDAATSALRFSSAYYDLYLTGASNKPSRELEGRVSVSEQVTR